MVVPQPTQARMALRSVSSLAYAVDRVRAACARVLPASRSIGAGVLQAEGRGESGSHVRKWKSDAQATQTNVSQHERAAAEKDSTVKHPAHGWRKFATHSCLLASCVGMSVSDLDGFGLSMSADSLSALAAEFFDVCDFACVGQNRANCSTSHLFTSTHCSRGDSEVALIYAR